MSTQEAQSSIRRNGAPKCQKERRKPKSTGINGEPSKNGVIVTTPKEPLLQGSTTESLRDISTLRNETKAEKFNDTWPSSQDMKSEKPKRFIAFIGNLPFTTNHDAVKKHFLKLNPISIRHPTSKLTGKSKGFAFLEFAGYDRMKTCLKMYHQSIFDDGASPPRKINVELTAGGGGSSSVRKSKLRAKNEKLNQERKGKMLAESKPAPNDDLLDVSDSYRIHPSRRKMMTN